MLRPPSALTSQQSKPTTATIKQIKQLLNIAATQELSILKYHKRNIVLTEHSDSCYLDDENAQSRAGGHHHLPKNVGFSTNNSAIHNVAKIIKAVLLSTKPNYINTQKAVKERQI